MAMIAEDPRLRALRRDVEALWAGSKDTSGAHDLAHAVRVAAWTIRLGQSRVDPASAIAAALLHDVISLPKNHPERSRSSEKSAALARQWLSKLGFAPQEIDEISDAIENHSFSRGGAPQRWLGKCLQDADRIEALGSIGIFRVVSTGTSMGSAYFDPMDPWARRRELDDRSFCVDHFFTKLLKLPETMNTAQGREEAERRAAKMHEFLEQLGEELGDPL